VNERGPQAGGAWMRTGRIAGMAFRAGSLRRLFIAAVILSCVYLSVSSYMRCYFAYSRLDGWSGGQVKVRYYADERQRPPVGFGLKALSRATPLSIRIATAFLNLGALRLTASARC
jgi:hypothetical protein